MYCFQQNSIKFKELHWKILACSKNQINHKLLFVTKIHTLVHKQVIIKYVWYNVPSLKKFWKRKIYSQHFLAYCTSHMQDEFCKFNIKPILFKKREKKIEYEIDHHDQFFLILLCLFKKYKKINEHCFSCFCLFKIWMNL